MKKYQLKEIGEILTGNTPSKKNEEYYNAKDIPFIKPNDLSLNKITPISKGIEYLSLAGMNASRTIPKGGILVTCIGTIGKIGILQVEKAAFNQQINAIVPNESIVNGKYLAYKLAAKREELKHLANAPVVPIINKTQFSNFEIELPNLEEQIKVVEVLERFQSLTDKRNNQISALSSLAQSVFLEMFGDPVKNTKNWELRKLDDLGKWSSGGTPSRKEKEYFQGDIPWLSSGELNQLYTYSSNEQISEKAISETAAKLIPVDSLLLGMYDTAGLKSTINKVECSCNQAIAFSKLNSEIVSTEYVYFTIQLLKEFLKNQQRGVRQKNFNLTMIKNIEIIYPPLDLQEKFKNVFLSIEKQKQMLEKSLIQLENSFNAFIQQVF